MKTFRRHRLLGTTYESLVSDPECELMRIQRFLDLPQVQLKTGLRKQNTRLLREAIANYDDLREHFEGSVWAEFFDE